MNHIGRLERVALREVWRHEARDFTTWLANNLELLGEMLGLSLTLIQTEVATGMFSADILADAGGDRYVVIENQLESTDHDHLGKLITYMSNLDARIAIWVTSTPRPEHENAIHWLNEWLPNNMAFYLVKVEAYRIGGSPPAPLFSIIAGPSTAAKQAGETKKELAERHILRKEFWSQLLQRAKEKTSLHSNVSSGTENWISAGAGRSGLSYNYLILISDARVELYIDRADAATNKCIFDSLYAEKATIESALGVPLEWQRLDGRKACRIGYTLHGNGLLNKESWPELQAQMIDKMLQLEQTFKPYIQSLDK